MTDIGRCVKPSRRSAECLLEIVRKVLWGLELGWTTRRWEISDYFF